MNKKELITLKESEEQSYEMPKDQLVADAAPVQKLIDKIKSGVQYIRYRKARGIMDKGGVCACDEGEFDFYTVMDKEIVGYDAIPGSPVHVVSGPELAKIRSSKKWHWKAD